MEWFLKLDETKKSETYYLDKTMLDEVIVLKEPANVDMEKIVQGKRNIPLHSHTFYEMIYVLSGRGTHWANDAEFSMKKGDVILLAPNVLHKYMPALDCYDLRVYNVIFQVIPNENLSLEKDYAIVSLSSEALLRFDYFLHNMETEFITKPIGYKQNLYAYCQLLCSELLRANDRAINTAQSTNLELVFEYIETHYSTTNFKECAKISSYSPTYFCRLFKEATGLTFSEYINNKKVMAAAKLLLETDAPIESIADQVNLQNGNHFYSLFKKHMGVTPKAFRKMRKIG